jgi:aspartate carbamoyltransferase catalytic subunit
MTLESRNLVTIEDLSNGEIEAVFSLADQMAEAMGKQFGTCKGKIMASLFFEPSTRTRLSFETAMHRLGGSVITAADVGATSLSKGESIADMARVIGAYADIIVIRHPWEGAAKVVADYAGIPVINAGDGGHEHPTQTLCDLYTIKKERQTIKGLRIALWGDLKYGRTIPSLVYALARFGATILFRPGPGLELPEHVMHKLGKYDGRLERYANLNEKVKQRLFPLDAIYITPSQPHQLANIPSVSAQVELEEGVDVLYVTRLQLERLETTDQDEELKKDYPVVDRKLLREKEFRKTMVLHPLPRVSELAREIDADPRSAYFKQAGRGVPVRMALLALLLGSKQISTPEEKEPLIRAKEYPLYRRGYGVSCTNPRCVSVQKSEVNFIRPEFKIVGYRPLTLRCLYCEHEVYPQYVASSDWHEGKLESKKYHSADSHWATKIKPENLIIFDSASEAKARGFKPGHYAREGSEK